VIKIKIIFLFLFCFQIYIDLYIFFFDILDFIMSDLKAESNVTTSQKPIPRIKEISMMKAWKDSKVRF